MRSGSPTLVHQVEEHMNTSDNNNTFGDFLAAELTAVIRELNCNHELKAQIMHRGIETPVADESEWEKTVDGSIKRNAIDKVEFLHPYIPPSLYGW
jgi:hypothetical protein